MKALEVWQEGADEGRVSHQRSCEAKITEARVVGRVGEEPQTMRRVRLGGERLAVTPGRSDAGEISRGVRGARWTRRGYGGSVGARTSQPRHNGLSACLCVLR